ncbi:MAG: T9SS type A sorting domain-containing protein [Candidatus Cloacimonadota bacterium]|nr:MAG: T9SS type A sorting domain-containing protein [Candidatus Cloacimonadota bacterium]
MKKSHVFLIVMVSFFIQKAFCFAQPYHSQIGISYVDYATAYGNGFKVVPVMSTLPEDVIYAVYSYNEDTCYFAYSYDRGLNWASQPFYATLYENAHFPSMDVYDSLPYVVSQGDSGGQGEIFLRCPLDWGIPQRISFTPGHSTLPAIVIDDNFDCHIVWQDNTDGNWEIYYCCAHYDTSVSGVVNLSDNIDISDIYPSISIYNGSEIHVVWQRYDPSCYSPYSIVHRYLNGGSWSAEDTLAGSTYIPLNHPSLDFCHGEDDISAAWEDSTAGNLDIFFYQGIVGPYPTSGQSRYPVLSTMSTVWAYAYWEDNSDGYDDIYGVKLYNPGGRRYLYKFRDVYGDEDMHYPNVTNCYVVWTQGDSVPYKVMFACEGYPIGTEESQVEDINTPKLQVYPNPFTSVVSVQLQCEGYSAEGIELTIYDVSGRLVKSFPLTTNHLSLTTDFQPGVYFLKVDGYEPVKVVKLR